MVRWGAQLQRRCGRSNPSRSPASRPVSSSRLGAGRRRSSSSNGPVGCANSPATHARSIYIICKCDMCVRHVCISSPDPSCSRVLCPRPNSRVDSLARPAAHTKKMQRIGAHTYRHRDSQRHSERHRGTQRERGNAYRLEEVRLILASRPTSPHHAHRFCGTVTSDRPTTASKSTASPSLRTCSQHRSDHPRCFELTHTKLTDRQYFNLRVPN